MKRILLNSFLFSMLSIFVVSCAKEEVKPFCGGHENGEADKFEKRGIEGDTNGDGIVDEFDLIDQGGIIVGDTNGDGVLDNLDLIDLNKITDGGNSSDYDTKGSRKKKVH